MSTPWTDFELQCLYDVVNDINWFENAARVINRSPIAIRAKMSTLRREAGIIPQNNAPHAKAPRLTEYERAKQGSERLLNAMLEMAA
jgi:hypothetical protein